MKHRTSRFLPFLALALLPLAAAARGGEKELPLKRELLEKLVGDHWGGLYAGGKKAGWMHSTLKLEKRGEREVVVCDSETQMKTQYGGMTVEAGGTAREEYAADTGELLLMESTTTMGKMQISSVRVVPDGEGFKQTYLIGGKEQVAQLPRCGHNLRAALAPQLLAAAGQAEIGDEVSGEQLMPDLGVVRVKHTVRARKKLLFRGVPTETIEVHTQLFKVPKPGEPAPEKPSAMASMTAMVDASGRTIEGQIMGLFTFRLESKESAKRVDQVADIMLATGVRLDRAIDKARRTSKVVLEIEGMPEETALSDDRQSYGEPRKGVRELKLGRSKPPEKSAPASDEERKKLAEFLAPTRFLQSDDPRIVKLATETVGAETDPYQAACLLNTWVFRNIAKIFTPMMSNALDTLQTRRGDCGEHAALFVALCRAAGIPAREVAGLAYADETGEALLGGHAWAEVYSGGRWIAMDPTFGQKLADPLHIKIAEGGMSGLDGMLRMAELMSKLKVKVVSAE